MKKSILLFALIMTIVSFSSCAYVNVKAPLDLDVNQTQLGSKTGYSSARSLLYLFAWGDAGTKAAAENGGISVINHMDIQIQSYLLGLYTKKTVIVYGD